MGPGEADKSASVDWSFVMNVIDQSTTEFVINTSHISCAIVSREQLHKFTAAGSPGFMSLFSYIYVLLGISKRCASLQYVVCMDNDAGLSTQQQRDDTVKLLNWTQLT